MDSTTTTPELGNHLWYLLLIAVAPVAAYLYYIYQKDKYNKEPLSMLAKVFLYGVVIAFPVGGVEVFLGFFNPLFCGLFSGLFTTIAEESTVCAVLSAFYTSFVVAAVTEESFKLLVIKTLVWNHKEFDERFDGIVYAVCASLGFACIENVFYVLGAIGEDGIIGGYSTGIMRAIFSIPGHFFFAVIMGYYFAIAKFSPKEKQDFIIFKGWFWAVIAHGVYDTFCYLCAAKELSDFSILLFLVFIGLNIVAWIIGHIRIAHFSETMTDKPGVTLYKLENQGFDSQKYSSENQGFDSQRYSSEFDMKKYPAFTENRDQDNNK